MTPDDERPRPSPDAETETGSSVEPDGDDLESLAVALPSAASEAPDADDEVDLEALAALGRQRPSMQGGDDETRLSLGGGAVAAAPSQAPARAAWVMPLVLGLGIGAGVAAVVFVATGARDSTASAASQPAQQAPARAVSHAPGIAAGQVAATAAPARSPEPPAPALAPVAAPAAASAAATPTARKPSAAADRSPAATPDSRPVQAEAPAAGPVLALRPAGEESGEAPGRNEAPGAKLPGEETNAKAASGSVDALLDEALAPAARRNELARAQEAALAVDQLPMTPSKEDVTQAMTVLLPAIRGCAMGQSGLAMAGIVVRGDGRVAGVEVTGAPFAGTASGRCMEGVIRKARFTRFKQPTLRIRFPLAIQ